MKVNWWVVTAAGAGILALATGRRVLGYVRGKPVELELKSIGGGLYLRADVASWYNAMKAAASAMGVTLQPSGPRSAFRTPEQQASLTIERAEYAAQVNHSPHQGGIAIDLETTNSATNAWLTANAGKFGFRRTVSNEPWHFEYRA